MYPRSTKNSTNSIEVQTSEISGLLGSEPDADTIRDYLLDHGLVEAEPLGDAFELQALLIERLFGPGVELEIVDIYPDNKKKGHLLKGRAGLKRLLDDASDNKFDLVVVWDVARWARDVELGKYLARRLRYYGCEFFSVDEPEVNTLHSRAKDPWHPSCIPYRRYIEAVAKAEAKRKKDRSQGKRDARARRRRGLKVGGEKYDREKTTLEILALKREVGRKGEASNRAVATQLGISRMTVNRYLAEKSRVTKRVRAAMRRKRLTMKQAATREGISFDTLRVYLDD